MAFNDSIVVAVIFLLLLISGSAAFTGDLEPLSQSLTLHVSFDNGLDADFSRGAKSCLVLQKGELVPAEQNHDMVISQETGRFGHSLHFTKKSAYRPSYLEKDVLNYNSKNWSTTVSVWLRCNPDRDLEPGYCDPIQIIGDDLKKGFVFLEWSKDETPRHFRYAIRPLFSTWNPDNLKWDEIPVEKRPMVQVANVPFSSESWTHVVFTLENVNDKSQPQRGRLFLNGSPAGIVQNWDLTFGWNAEKVRLILGAAYVGHLDDLAVFNRPLTETEVQQIYQLQNGIRDLHR